MSRLFPSERPTPSRPEKTDLAISPLSGRASPPQIQPLRSQDVVNVANAEGGKK